MPELLHDKWASRGTGYPGIRVPAQRVVTPEILDFLAHDDPAAKKSRRDLAWINWMMGNDRWILRQLAKAPRPVEALCELGAGDGGLVAKMHRRFPAARIAACDLVPKPAALSDRIDWHSGDLMKVDPPAGGVLVCNLFLHHFEQEMLERMGAWFDHFDALLINEPARCSRAHALGKMIDPWVHEVTRHDMHVSINAGFMPGEIVQLTRMAVNDWQIEEEITWRGALRFAAWKL